MMGQANFYFGKQVVKIVVFLLRNKGWGKRKNGLGSNHLGKAS